MTFVPLAKAADTLGNAPPSQPVPPAVLSGGESQTFWLPGVVVPGLVPDVVINPGTVLPEAKPGMIVPEVRLPDGTVAPGIVGPEGKVEPAVIDPEGKLVPGVVDSEGQLVPALVDSQGKRIPAAVGPEGTLVPGIIDAQGLLVPAVKGPDGKLVPVVPVVPVVPGVPGQAFTPSDFLLREKDVLPGMPPKTEAKLDPEKTPEKIPEKTPEKAPTENPEKKPEPPKSVAKGQALRIPEGAGSNGDLSFLEGCWKGYRPEYNSKRMITERFCFDASGRGKRTIIDPAKTGICFTPTRALINSGDVLKVQSDAGYCINGVRWNKSVMTCKGSGAKTPCTWVFGPKDSQSYTISLVRD